MIGADTTFLVSLEVLESPSHQGAHTLLNNEILSTGTPLGVAPQVLAEFVHVVTDPRRFQKPLSMEEALRRAEIWWNAAEVQRVYPTASSTVLFFQWMARHKLGRKRILDTQLAASLWEARTRRIISGNASDFQLLGFDVLTF